MNTSSVPRKAITLYNHALELSNKGILNTALDEYKKAIEIFPHFVEAYNNIGEIYSQMGDKDLAICFYRYALNIEKNSRVLLNLGVEYYNNKKYNDALPLFLEAISLDPGFLEGNYYTGLTFYNLNDLYKAENYLEKVIAFDKKHYKTNYLLSYIYYEWQQYDKTIECLDRIKNNAEDKSFLNKYYGFCYFHLKDYKKAITYLTDALTLKPQYKKFKSYLEGLTYENKIKEIGDVEQNIKDLEKKMKKEDLNIREVSKLSMLYIFQGNNKKAEKILVAFKERMAS